MDTGRMSDYFYYNKDKALIIAKGAWDNVRSRYESCKANGDEAEADKILMGYFNKVDNHFKHKYPDFTESEREIVYSQAMGFSLGTGDVYIDGMTEDEAMGALLEGKPPEPGEDFIIEEGQPTEQDDTEEIIDLTPQNPDHLDTGYDKNKGDNTIRE